VTSKATQAPAKRFRSYRIFSRRWVRPPAILLLGLVLFSVSALLAVSGAPDKALTHSQIAEANKPGTVMIYTRWTSTISVPREQIRVQALIDFATNEANRGLIQNNSNARFRALFDELLRHPNVYLVPSEDMITMESILPRPAPVSLSRLMATSLRMPTSYPKIPTTSGRRL
jgi:hypothetical protein